jgi:hypothetical protein
MGQGGREDRSGRWAIVGVGHRHDAQNGTHAVVEAIRAEALFQSGDRCLDTAAERLVVEHGCDPGRESGRTGVLQLRQGATSVWPPSTGTKTGRPASTICATVPTSNPACGREAGRSAPAQPLRSTRRPTGA